MGLTSLTTLLPDVRGRGWGAGHSMRGMTLAVKLTAPPLHCTPALQSGEFAHCKYLHLLTIICTNWLKLQICSNVPRQECSQAPRQQCESVARRVPSQRCFQIPREQCGQVQRQVQQEQCREVPRQQCQTVPRQQCRSLPRQQCR